MFKFQNAGHTLKTLYFLFKTGLIQFFKDFSNQLNISFDTALVCNKILKLLHENIRISKLLIPYYTFNTNQKIYEISQ